MAEQNSQDMGTDSQTVNAHQVDELTGLPNRNSGLTSIEAACRDAQSGHNQPAVLVIDIDNFQRFNAHNGYQAGDDLLRRFGALSIPLLPARARLYRLGGDAFLVILENCTSDEAMSVAQSFCDMTRDDLPPHQLDTCGDPHCRGPANISASIGVASFEPGLDHSVLLHRADHRMCDAKVAGKDTVRAW